MGLKHAEGRVEIEVVSPSHRRFAEVVELASMVLEQDRYLLNEVPGVIESHVVAAFAGRCVGFIRFVIQVIGQDVGRPPVLHGGAPLLEGYVEAFGVDPEFRRRGVGTELQMFVANHCRGRGCYQMRSRSPMTSTENYQLKIDAGYVLHPSEENNSYYLIQRL